MTDSRIPKKSRQSTALLSDVEAYLARGGEITQVEQVSQREAHLRSKKRYKDPDNPNRLLPLKSKGWDGPMDAYYKHR
mgnify:CR=1 FL=1